MQTIDEEGNLLNADRMDVPGKNLLYGDAEDDDVATADLRKNYLKMKILFYQQIKIMIMV